MPSTNGQGPKRAILYTRVSSKGQAEEGYSLDGQLHEVRAFAEAQGWEAVGEPVVDAGEKRWMYNRPRLDRIKEMAAQGGVDVVLAWRWDRFGESPWPELLAVELEEYGTKLRALDDSGEGEDAEILRVLKGQLAKKDQRQRVERSLMGKSSKVRQGEVLGAAPRPRYGFEYVRNDKGRAVGYRPDQEKMAVVERIFAMLSDGESIHSVQRYLEQRNIPAPAGGKRWSRTTIRGIVLDDCYRPHSYAEIQELVSPQVAATLDSAKQYGVSWWGKRKTRYKSFRSKKRTAQMSDRSEWVAVPVDISGTDLSREVVDAARAAIKDNQPCSSAGDRFWELSGGILVCGDCGRRMIANRRRRSPNADSWHLYYRCLGRRGQQACTNRGSIRAEEAEERVWQFVLGLLKDPDLLRQGLEQMIEEERNGMRGNPDLEAKAWAQKLAEVDLKRSRFQDMAAEGLISFEELKAKLAELEEAREVARREMISLECTRERIAQLERDKEELLDSYAGIVPEALAALGPEERHHHVYRVLRLKVLGYPDGKLEVSGAFGGGVPVCTPEHTSS